MKRRTADQHWYDQATGVLGLVAAALLWLVSAPSKDILFNDVATEADATGTAIGCGIFAVASAIVLIRILRRPLGAVRSWTAILALAASTCLMAYTAGKSLSLKTVGAGGSIWNTSEWTLGLAFSIVLLVCGLLPLLRRRRVK